MTRKLRRMDPRWPPGRRRNWLEQTGFFFYLLLCPASGICPSRCECNDKALEASCTHSGLEVVPIQLNPDVQILQLHHNRIANIDMTLSFYTRLTDLNLAHNKIRDLGSRNFEFQNSLVKLNLSYNSIRELRKDAFRGLSQLQILDLHGNGLEHISHQQAFRDLMNLQVLDLSKNNILSVVPGGFDHLTDLRRLLLNENQILSMLELGISKLHRLEELNLDLNLIQEVLFNANLTSLQTLKLRSNLITTLNNESFECIPSLRHLDISDNNLTLVPSIELSKLENLHILNLSSNLFEHLGPNAFRKLYKLREIYLDGMATVRKLDAKLFIDNPSLETVSLSSNRMLRYLPKLLLANKLSLKHVRISNNGFSTLDASDLPLDHLETLQIGRNPFVCNCSLLWLWILKERQTSDNCTEGCAQPLRQEKFSYSEDYSDENFSDELETMPLSFTAVNHKLFKPVLLDLDEVYCFFEGKRQFLRDASKTAFDCSSPWVVVLSASIILSICLLLVGITAYLVRVRIRRKSKNPVETFLNASKTYENTHHTYYRYATAGAKTAGTFPDSFCVNNMYMLPPEQHHTGSLRPASAFGKNAITNNSRHYVSEANIYQEPFAGPILSAPQKPHVVYV